ncbi:hypothetical protein PENSPDRAFT_439088 [Peniophora sp. CONT]|nr:hypothetical protein PENSPDRAFT_439088 [Peniophora sp. CONT]
MSTEHWRFRVGSWRRRAAILRLLHISPYRRTAPSLLVLSTRAFRAEFLVAPLAPCPECIAVAPIEYTRRNGSEADGLLFGRLMATLSQVYFQSRRSEGRQGHLERPTLYGMAAGPPPSSALRLSYADEAPMLQLFVRVLRLRLSIPRIRATPVSVRG